MNQFASEFTHTVVALDSNTTAAKLVDRCVPVRYENCPKTSNPAAMASRLAATMRRLKPNLVLTYNWGSIDAVIASGLLCRIPVVHTEDGFGQDEASGQKFRRVWTRRLALRLAERIVAPSRTLVNIMTGLWKLPASKVLQIPNGIDHTQFRPRPVGHVRQLSSPGEIVVGTVGHLRPEKRQEALIEACARLSERFPIRLLIAGDGSERNRLERVAAESGIFNRVSFLGHRRDIAQLYWEFDLFALTSTTEQMPLSVLEAMAAALPIVSTAVGDVPHMVSLENRSAVVKDLPQIEPELARLASSKTLRRQLGAANRRQLEHQFSTEHMARQYWDLYHAAAAEPVREAFR